MHDYPPCRKFTPVLSCLYEEFNEDQKQIETVFFLGDKNYHQFEEYYGKMRWLALPRD